MASKECTFYMEDMLTCSVCLELVKDPQTLTQCLHNYCKPCTQQLIQKQNHTPRGVTCPLCAKFSAEGEIRNNHFVTDLLGLHGKIKEDGKLGVKQCEQCEVGKPPSNASWRCLDCRANICDECRNIHFRVAVLKGHRLLQLTEETELVVDKLVFCSKHADEILKLYCRECHDVICMMCHVVTHKVHDTVTVEQALDTILPDVDQNLKGLAAKLQHISKTIDDNNKEKSKADKAYEECVQNIDKKTEERIKQIYDEQTKMKSQLKKERDSQMKQFQDTKIELVNLQKQLSNLQKVTATSVKRARHVTLLQELVQGGLLERLQRVNSEKYVMKDLQIKLPSLQTNDVEWIKLVAQGLLGGIKLDNVNIKVGKVSDEECVGNAGMRYWKGDFTQVFGKQLNQILKIELSDFCDRVTVSNNKVWIPIRTKKLLNVYNKQGKLEKSIEIAGQPLCVEKSCTGDMLVFCQDTGLFILSKESEQLVNIDNGKYSDMCMYGEKVYTLGHYNRQIVEFVRERTGWKRQDRVVKVQTMPAMGLITGNDTLLVRQCEEDKGQVEFFVGLYYHNTICRVSQNGKQISQYDGRSEQVERKLQNPQLCGVDSQGQILVADYGSNKYKVLNTKTGEWRTVFTGDDGVYDAKIEDEHTIWLSRRFRGKHTITKHVAQV